MLVAAGILMSRVAGLVRQRVLAHFLGLSDAADAFAAAFRIPNFLQNLFGEGVLSASFIPVYSRLVGEGRHQDARRLAGTVAGLLGLAIGVLVALGVTGAPWLIQGLVPGFSGEKRALAIVVVRILFPGAGLLVLSAWCLGVLNSHRHFFLSYAAPVVWNLAIIAATLLAPTDGGPEGIVVWTAWGAVVGGLLQFAIQVPAVLRLAGGIRPSVRVADDNTRSVFSAFFPAFLGRGVVQIGGFIDSILASFLGTGAVAALSNAQMLYTLPISLFGMSVAAAELPELARVASGPGGSSSALRARLEQAMRQVAFFVVPSAVALAALGQVLAGGVFQTGAFTESDARYVWGILAGSSIGLLAGTLARLYASAWYALGDTRTPMRCAMIRLLVGALLGWFAALQLPGLAGVAPFWGAAGLTAAGGIAGWAEFWLLRRALDQRIGAIRFPAGFIARLWGAALAGAAAGWGALLLIDGRVGPVVTAMAVVLAFGALYLGSTLVFGDAPARELARRCLKRP